LDFVIKSAAHTSEADDGGSITHLNLPFIAGTATR